MKTFRFVFLFVLLLLLLPGAIFAGGSGEAQQETKGSITVASKIDTEGALLGNMIVHLLEDDGFEVVDDTEFGPTDVIREAIISDEIDIYPEYTGNGAFFFEESDSDVWSEPTSAYERVRDLDLEDNDIVWLSPAPANNTWAIAIRSDLAEEHSLSSLSDLADFMNDSGSVKLAASEEFVTREDVLPAFEEEYGFEFSDDELLVFSGGNTAMTIQAASQETDGVNAAMAYGTDGQLASLDLTVLEDTEGVQPVYEPAPIVRGEVLDEYPELEDILNPVFEQLTLETLQELNARIAVDGEAADAVARDWLESNGFL
ncbi:MAG: ABC transporter substrate-binding protein [Spirochaetales bacterium]